VAIPAQERENESGDYRSEERDMDRKIKIR
jgi:hypothetical protein